jgi:tetratricopeptide (TPR) repeat protein
LGRIAQERQDFDQAEGWYRKALEIFERLGLERDAASDYHQLGIIAQERQDYDGAEGWYRKALLIFERLRHRPLMVNTLAQFGILMREQNRLEEAVGWFGKALAIAAEYKMRLAGHILADLARVVKMMGEERFASTWRKAFKEGPPLEAIREALRHLHSETGET